MATRSIVAEPYGDGWRGRYVHWDGSPNTRVLQLQLLVARDGVEMVRDTIVHKHLSWSTINPAESSQKEKPLEEWRTEWRTEDEPRFALVEGYGIVHNDIEQSEADKWMFSCTDLDFAWAEYLYILGDSTIIVCEYVNEQWQPLSVERYTTLKLTSKG